MYNSSPTSAIRLLTSNRLCKTLQHRNTSRAVHYNGTLPTPYQFCHTSEPLPISDFFNNPLLAHNTITMGPLLGPAACLRIAGSFNNHSLTHDAIIMGLPLGPAARLPISSSLNNPSRAHNAIIMELPLGPTACLPISGSFNTVHPDTISTYQLLKSLKLCIACRPAVLPQVQFTHRRHHCKLVVQYAQRLCDVYSPCRPIIMITEKSTHAHINDCTVLSTVPL